MLPWATGPLTSLESIAEVPDRQVAKTGKNRLLSDSLRHKSLGTALTTYRNLSTQTILQSFSSTPMSILSAKEDK